MKARCCKPMTVRPLIPFIALILAVVAVSGCDSKPSGPSAEDRTQAQLLAGEGFDLLIGALMDTTTTASESDLRAAKLKFEEALELHPKNGDANVGLALTELILMGYNPELLALFDGSFTSRLGLGKIAMDAPNGWDRFTGLIPAAKQTGIFPSNMLDLLKVDLFRLAQNDPIDVGSIQDIVETAILATLDRIIDHFETVENLDEWQMVLTSEQYGMGEGFQIEIDQTDIYMLDVIVHLLKAPFHPMVAYNLNIPDIADTTAVKATFNQTDGPFWTLRPNGADNMRAFRTTLLDGVARMSSFLVSLEAETDDQTDDLIKLDPTGEGGLSPADIDSLVPGITEFVGVLNGPITITGNFDDDAAEESVLVNISVIFTDPIPDIKGLFPPYYWDSAYQGWYWDGYPENDFSQFVFPDASIHGILPDFAPSGDAMLKAVFNIDTFPSSGPLFSITNVESLFAILMGGTSTLGLF